LKKYKKSEQIQNAIKNKFKKKKTVTYQRKPANWAKQASPHPHGACVARCRGRPAWHIGFALVTTLRKSSIAIWRNKIGPNLEQSQKEEG
jgi:hypothetical protein